LIHIYTGDCKGKTTAAIGLLIRAFGAGKKVALFQFMKGRVSSEIFVLEKLGILVDREWDDKFIIKTPSKLQLQMAKNQLKRVFMAIDGRYDLVILDEIIVAVHFGLLKEEELLSIMDQAKCELVLTGQKATFKMIEKADLVTEMKKIKHYFDKGIDAREGIEY
jgi:cob(I)alamin adenosyltransferase